MTSKHSLYKSKSRLAKATAEQKINSIYSRKINNLNKLISNLNLKLKANRYTLKKHSELFKKLVDENIVSKEYCKPFLPRKEDAMKEVIKSLNLKNG